MQLDNVPGSVVIEERPLPVAHIKRRPADWRVSEQLDLVFTGAGEHAYFYVEKECLNTADVAAALAQACEVPGHFVGYAGLKDKHAVTRQWFSVPSAEDEWPLELAGARCLQVQRHSKKLRRGQHTLNRFEICLSGLLNDDDPQLDRLGEVFPNYFGPQRTSTSNISQARQWLAKGQWGSARPGRPRQRTSGGRRGWHLSVLRSMLFNKVLEQRVRLHNYAQMIDGDVAQQGLPTGPLWGRGRSASSGRAQEIERCALADWADTCEALEYTGLNQARRKLAERPHEFVSEISANGEMLLRFALPPGVFATTLLANNLQFVDDSLHR